jgi:hypothetical protein
MRHLLRSSDSAPSGRIGFLAGPGDDASEDPTPDHDALSPMAGDGPACCGSSEHFMAALCADSTTTDASRRLGAGATGSAADARPDPY